MALSLPDSFELPHFEKTSFRINLPDRQAGKKIFATLAEEKSITMLILSLIDQSVFCSFDKTIIYPVPGGWGKQGCTFINLKKVRKEMFMDALTTAWKTIAGTKLAEKYFGKE